MRYKLVAVHALVILISIMGGVNIYEYVQNEIVEMIVIIFHLLTISYLYVFSGYFITDKQSKYNFWNYQLIALIGIILWTVAVINSSNDLDWKNGSGGIPWLAYRIYISGVELPFNVNDNFSFWTQNLKINMGFLLTLSLVPSLLQAFGGYLKVNQKS